MTIKRFVYTNLFLPSVSLALPSTFLSFPALPGLLAVVGEEMEKLKRLKVIASILPKQIQTVQFLCVQAFNSLH